MAKETAKDIQARIDLLNEEASLQQSIYESDRRRTKALKESEKIQKQILAEENVEHEVRGVYGVYDIVLKISSDNAEKLRAIITNRIRKISKVQSTLTMMVIEEQENL